MDWLLLTPESIRTLSLVVLNSAIAVYLLRIPGRSQATSWLATFTGTMSVFYLMRFAQASVFPLEAMGAWGPLRMTVECLALPVAMGAWLQFAYRFLDNPFPREARAALALSGLLVVGFAICAAWLLPGRREVLPLYLLYAPTSIAFCALASAVLLRKRRRLGEERASRAVEHSVARASRAYLSFAGLSALYAVTSVVIGSVLGWSLLPGIFWVVAAIPGVFAFYGGLVVCFVSHAREPTTLQAKLVGLSLATALAVLGVAVVLADLPAELVRESGVLPSDEEAFQFTPDSDGGYAVRSVPPTPDARPGERLTLDERHSATIPLGFSFPYYGALVERATIGALGVVVLGEAVTVPAGGFLPHRDFGGELPSVSPLFGFPIESVADTRNPEVYLDRAPGRLRVTWRFPRRPGPRTFARVELLLEESGAIRFAYGGLDDVEVEPYAQVGLRSGGLRGLSPGGVAPRIEHAALAGGGVLSLPARTGLVDDLGLRLRLLVHRRSARLFGLLLATALFTLLVLPPMLRSGLLHPLERLLEGVRRVNAGNLDVALPISARDEIGILTENFNVMANSLRGADAEQRSHAAELETRVAERTVALEAGKAQLEGQARRLRALDELKTRFFSDVSHELRTPLTLILGPLQDALAGRAGADELARHVPVMHRNAGRLLDLINQLLDLARLEAGGVDLRACRTDLVGFLRGLTLPFSEWAEREGLALVFHAETPELEGYVDRDKLEKAVANLLWNAFKFTPRGGKVRLGVASFENADGAFAEIAVEDTGPGIPADELPHVFDRFHRGHGSSTREHGGTGIGLALAKELVELHHGAIRVSSTVGFGTTFTLRLPVGSAHLLRGEIVEHGDDVPREASGSGESTQARDESSPVAPSGERKAGAPATVLVVEDNDDLRAFLRASLGRAYDVVEARDGVEGLDQAQARRPDLVLADVMMPRMDGLTLCRRLKEEPSLGHIPVVLLTARADDESRLAGLGTGADDYLTKPFDTEELMTRAENLIEVRRQLLRRFRREAVLGPTDVTVPSAETAWIVTVRDAVEQRLGDSSLTVEGLAKDVAVSKRHLQRRLKEATSLSPNGFIRAMRLERAATLLAQRAGTVSEIAYRVGFNDPDYFSKLFRQVFGVVPSEYSGPPRT